MSASIDSDPLPEELAAAVATLLRNGPCGFALFDPSGKLLHLNPAGARIFGSPASEMVGENVALPIHPDDRTRFLRSVARARRDGEPGGPVECRVRRCDGQWIWLELAVLSLADDAQPGLLALQFTDITGRKIREQELLERQRLLHAAVEGTSEAVFVKDREGRYQLINRAGAGFLGRSAEEVIGRDATEMFSSDSAHRIVDADRRVLETGKPETFEYEATAAGVTRAYLATRGPLFDAEGNVIGVVGISRDVTERKQAEEAVRAAHEELRAIVEAAPAAIVALSIDGRVTTWNPAAEKIFGWTAEEVMGQLPPFIPDANEESYRNRLQRAAREEIFTNMEVRRVRKDGREMDASLAVSALHSATGELTGYMSVLADITDRKRAEAELQALTAALEERVKQRTAELESLNQELETFSYAVSHDLRGPLTVIGGYARTLLLHDAEHLSDSQRFALERIVDSCERMGRLIDGLMSLARLGKDALCPEQVDLTALAWNAVEELHRAEPDRKVEVSIERGLSTHADLRLMSVVLSNLLGNAWKFTANQPNARIEVGCIRNEGQGVFYVRDNGAGFEQAKAARLFQPFQRLHSREQYNGSGIGLATVGRVVERHGGRIWAEGTPGEGAAFFFTIGEQDVPNGSEKRSE